MEPSPIIVKHEPIIGYTAKWGNNTYIGQGDTVDEAVNELIGELSPNLSKKDMENLQFAKVKAID